MDLGKIAVLNVRTKVFVGLLTLSRYTEILRTPLTCWSASSDAISASEMPARSGHLINPLEVFRLACGLQVEGMVWNFVSFKRLSACDFLPTSTRSAPERNFFTDFGEPAIDCGDFSITKGDSFASWSSGLVDSMSRNLEKFEEV